MQQNSTCHKKVAREGWRGAKYNHFFITLIICMLALNTKEEALHKDQNKSNNDYVFMLQI